MMKTTLVNLLLFLAANYWSQSSCSSSLKETILCHSMKFNIIDSNEKYIWIGTRSGLYFLRRNGKGKVKSYKLSTGDALEVTCIRCLKDGEVLVGTKYGILKYDGFTFYMLTTENSSLPENQIESISVGTDGAPFICTANHTLKMLNGNKFTLIDNKESNHILAENNDDIKTRLK